MSLTESLARMVDTRQHYKEGLVEYMEGLKKERVSKRVQLERLLGHFCQNNHGILEN